MAIKAKLEAIADAIRSKTGKTDTMTMAEMPSEIESISGGTMQNSQAVISKISSNEINSYVSTEVQNAS